MDKASPSRAAYGSWRSPLSVDDVLAGSASPRELSSDASGLYWIESIPHEDGRATLMHLGFDDGQVSELTPGALVRSRLHSYGGGAYAVLDSWIVYLDDAQATIEVRSPDGDAWTLRHLASGEFFGGLQLARLGEQLIVLGVREDASDPEHSLTSLVALPAAGPDAPMYTLLATADFYATPVLSQDGMLAWTQWDQPAMPWDATQLFVARLEQADGQLRLGQQILVAGSNAGLDGVALQHPQWDDDGTLLFISDQSGFYNLHRFDPQTRQSREVHQEVFDFDEPAWTADNRSYAILAGGAVLTSFRAEGLAYLALLKDQTRRLTGIAGLLSATAVHGTGYALVTRPNEGPAILEVGSDAQVRQIHGWDVCLDDAQVSVARSLTLATEGGPIQAWYYPPRNPDFAPLDDELPPMIVTVHGGPTLFHCNALDLTVQFWTSRGIAVLDVNYSGSAGFGRAYRNRLRENYGVADVRDVVAATDAAIDAGLADAKRVAISGSSSGGFTVLRALTSTDRFAAGISRYGIADLTKMVGGPKFEARYMESLLGHWPDQRARYEARSPINHVDKLASPLLILQGDADPIVPPEQSISMANAVRAKGLPVAILVFAGEGHGFRSATARRQALAAQLSFLSQLLGFVPDVDVARISIANL